VTDPLTPRPVPELSRELRVAVLLPCRNEERSVASVVSDFRVALPRARIYVYDNDSTDDTANRAKAAGAIVRRERRRGKGNVVCRMFADIDADVYVMADGDGTYDAGSAPEMVRLLVDEGLDMVVGCRVASEGSGVYPRGHLVGNRVFNRVLKMLFGARFTDVFSGYRVLSRRFVKSFPVRFTGFEIETELTAHTVEIGLPYAEVATPYRARDEGSRRKLRTVRDGFRILVAAIQLFKEMRPMRFFTLIAALLTVIAASLGAVVIEEFVRTGLVARLPTAVLAASIQIVAFICLTAGLVLESVGRSRRETRRLVYLGLEPVSPDLVGAHTADEVADENARDLALEPDGERGDDVLGRR
jgi:glycosyltransferase involved in cell wall biosynthesis